MESSTYLPGLDTSIIAFADDLISISPNIRGLQLMVDKCVEYGLDHLIKFNNKTQFVISGKPPIPNPSITINGNNVYPKENLLYLGFTWGNTSLSNILSLKQHKQERINKLWGTTASLISAGIKKLHPYSIAAIYRTIVIPQLLYGLEIVDISHTDLDHLDRQGRACFKSLLGLSKYSKNYLLDVFNVPEISSLIINRRVHLFDQLIKNNLTKSYILDSLRYTTTKCHVLGLVAEACHQSEIDLLEIAINGCNKMSLKNINKREPKPEDIPDIDSCKIFLSNWHIQEYRKSFRDLAQKEVKRT